MWEIYFADEKFPRLGARPGGSNNLVAYLRTELKQRQRPKNLILREDGAWKGGVPVMASIGMRYE